MIKEKVDVLRQLNFIAALESDNFQTEGTLYFLATAMYLKKNYDECIIIHITR